MTDLRKIDALIAEHVYGLTAYLSKHGYWTFGAETILAAPKFDAETGEQINQNWAWYASSNFLEYYSTDIALAIGVLEKLRAEHGWGWEIGYRGVKVRVACAGEEYFNCPLPEAICRHVLHVLEVSP